ncbi:hypothetical protein DFQ26_001754 [Actinomortierella ambigua]|nr:hypothetical protein DFQ26_001754 [Actinomortierella ambigua]
MAAQAPRQHREHDRRGCAVVKSGSSLSSLAGHGSAAVGREPSLSDAILSISAQGITSVLGSSIDNAEEDHHQGRLQELLRQIEDKDREIDVLKVQHRQEIEALTANRGTKKTSKRKLIEDSPARVGSLSPRDTMGINDALVRCSDPADECDLKAEIQVLAQLDFLRMHSPESLFAGYQDEHREDDPSRGTVVVPRTERNARLTAAMVKVLQGVTRIVVSFIRGLLDQIARNDHQLCPNELAAAIRNLQYKASFYGDHLIIIRELWEPRILTESQFHVVLRELDLSFRRILHVVLNEAAKLQRHLAFAPSIDAAENDELVMHSAHGQACGQLTKRCKTKWKACLQNWMD